jgi:NarL family two-component system response regulator LiaR
MPNKNIRVIVVDDHMVVRKGLRHVIAFFPGIVVVAEADSGEEALALCQQLQPDVVLMDVKMDGMGGIAATQAIRQCCPQIRVIALSTFQDTALVTQMLQARANGYLLKNTSAEDMEQAIHAVHAGETVLSPVIAKALEADKPAVSGMNPKLSAQQRKVLSLLVRGFNNTEIAGKLNISQPTARYHVSAILLKLGVATRVEAAAQAIKQHLLDTDFC